MRQIDLMKLRLTDILKRLSDREIAVLAMNIQRDPVAYPPAAERTQAMLDLVRQELAHRRWAL